jgi:hypothetical protein
MHSDHMSTRLELELGCYHQFLGCKLQLNLQVVSKLQLGIGWIHRDKLR